MKVIIFFLLFFSTLVFAQEIQLMGAIRIDVKTSYIPDVIITNMRTDETSVSNIFGRFTLKVQEGDVLRIMGDNLYTTYTPITNFIINNKDIIITMKPYVEELKEIIVYSYRLSGILAKDAFLIPYKNLTHEIDVAMKLPKAIGEGNIISDPVYNPSINPLSVNLAAVYDVLSGNRKKRERLLDWENREKKINYIKDYFGTSFFEQELKISENFIRDFIEFTFDTTAIESYYKNKDFSNISQLLQLQSIIFNKRLRSQFK